jgi:predicted site-specific integrase-resolvase
MSQETMYTPKQAAAELGVSDQSIYRWMPPGVNRATPRAHKPTRRYLIAASEVERAEREGISREKRYPP